MKRKRLVLASLAILLLSVMLATPVASARDADEWRFEPGCPVCVITGTCTDIGGLRTCEAVCAFP